MDPYQRNITIDMTPDGRFRSPGGPTWPVRLWAMATVVAISAAALVIGAVVLWLALWIAAIAAGAGMVAWAAFKFQAWRLRHR